MTVTPGENELTVQWTKPAGYWGGGIHGGYMVQWKWPGATYVPNKDNSKGYICSRADAPSPCYQRGGNETREISVEQGVTSVTLRNMKPGRQYTVRVLYGATGGFSPHTTFRAGSGLGFLYRNTWWRDGCWVDPDSYVLRCAGTKNGKIDPGETGIAFDVGYVLGEATGTPRAGQGQQAREPGFVLPPPLLTTARVNGAEMMLHFDGVLDQSSVPAASAFAVNVAGSARAVSSVTMFGQRVALTLASGVKYGELVTVGYTPPSTGRLRAPGGGTAVAAFSGTSVVNDTLRKQPQQAPSPELVSASVNGAVLGMSFDMPLDPSSVPAASAFSVKVAGGSRAVSAVSVSQATVTLTLASAVSPGEAVALNYTPPTTGRLRALVRHGAVTMFTGYVVTNNTPAPLLQRQAPPPLTASVASAPAEHRGKGRFTVTVAFSAAVKNKVKAVTPTIQVAGGTLKRARRAGGADRWALDITPSSNGPVTLTLPATADCAAAGAICTADGRRLETALTHAVPGPAGLSVADASAQEGAGATVDFAVTLSRAASQEVTVRYRTRNGTAKARRDYRKATGTLTFAAGETAKTVSVAVLDDAHDEGAETFRLLLSRPRGAVIADGEATGTITNDDPMPAAWLARFGRTVADQATDAVRARLEAGAEAPGHLTLAGRRVGAGADGTDAERALARRASEDAEAAAWATRVVARLADGEADPEAGARTLSGRDLLAGSSFLLPVGGADGPSWALWGQGAISGFEGSRDGMTLDGEVATLMLGLDRTQGPATLGVMVSRNAGRGMYRPADGNGAGEIEATMTGLFPYAGLGAGDRLSLWAMAGRAEGGMALTPPGGQDRDRIEAGMGLAMAALGARAVLKAAPEGGLELAVTPDAMAARTTSEAVPGLAASRSDVTRLRLGLEGAWRGGGFVPTLGLALRHDGGDAETGFGIEASGGVAWSDPGSGFSVELKGRTLFAHADDDVRERGISFALVRAPGPKGPRGVAGLGGRARRGRAGGGPAAVGGAAGGDALDEGRRSRGPGAALGGVRLRDARVPGQVHGDAAGAGGAVGCGARVAARLGPGAGVARRARPRARPRGDAARGGRRRPGARGRDRDQGDLVSARAGKAPSRPAPPAACAPKPRSEGAVRARRFPESRRHAVSPPGDGLPVGPSTFMRAAAREPASAWQGARHMDSKAPRRRHPRQGKSAWQVTEPSAKTASARPLKTPGKRAGTRESRRKRPRPGSQ